MRSALLSAVAVLCAGLPTALAQCPSGLYLNVWSNGINPDLFEAALVSDATGIQRQVRWNEIEPQQGSFVWDDLEETLSQADSAGKLVGIAFWASGGQWRKNTPNRVTPQHVLDDRRVAIVKAVTPRGTDVVYPLWTDPDYLARLGQVIGALAERYDGDPRIGFIRIGGMSTGTNEFTRGYSGAELDPDFAAQLDAAGYNDDTYNDALIALMELWRTHFVETPLCVTIQFGHAINPYATGLTALNTGLNTCDRTDSVLDEIASFDCFGWGGITNAEKCLSAVPDPQTQSQLRQRIAGVALGSGAQMVVVKDWTDTPIVVRRLDILLTRAR